MKSALRRVRWSRKARSRSEAEQNQGVVGGGRGLLLGLNQTTFLFRFFPPFFLKKQVDRIFYQVYDTSSPKFRRTEHERTESRRSSVFQQHVERRSKIPCLVLENAPLTTLTTK